jgi:hypothetical protein
VRLLPGTGVEAVERADQGIGRWGRIASRHGPIIARTATHRRSPIAFHSAPWSGSHGAMAISSDQEEANE